MYFAFISRENLLDLLPKGGVCAEIGVQQGAFSKEMLRRLSPSALHLVDLWQHQTGTAYVQDVGNASQDIQDAYHREVVETFKEHGEVVVHRTSSQAAATTFSDASFDFVYLDAMHTHDAVLGDLRAYGPKIKAGGILAGHDFCSHPYASRQGFGVIGAVSEFVKESDFEFFLITGELWATYLLVRKGQDAVVRSIVPALMASGLPFLELPDVLAPALRQKIYSLSNGELRMHPAFSV